MPRGKSGTLSPKTVSCVLNLEDMNGHHHRPKASVRQAPKGEQRNVLTEVRYPWGRPNSTQDSVRCGSAAMTGIWKSGIGIGTRSLEGLSKDSPKRRLNEVSYKTDTGCL